MAYFNTIAINGEDIIRPNGFSPQREDLYAGEIVTCIGNIEADLVGWKYADMTMQWDALPEDQLQTLLAMKGECTLEFDDADGESRFEKIVRTGAVSTATRHVRPDGTPLWTDVNVEVRFINAHNY